MKIKNLCEMVETAKTSTNFGMDVAAEFFKLGNAVRAAFERPIKQMGKEFDTKSEVFTLYAAAYGIIPAIVKDLKDDNPNHVHITHVVDILKGLLANPEKIAVAIKNAVATNYNQQDHGDFDDRNEAVKEIFNSYAEAAKAITPYNPLQQYCKDLCLELAKQNFEGASAKLTSILSLFDDEESLKRAATAHHKNNNGELVQVK